MICATVFRKLSQRDLFEVNKFDEKIGGSLHFSDDKK